MSKRSEWESRDEAWTSLKANKGFFGRWDDEVLASYVDEAMYATEDGKWRLKMPPLVEAVSPLTPQTLVRFRSLTNLSRLRPSS